MLLEIGEVSKVKGLLFIYPVCSKDIAIFKHCTGGRRYIAYDVFNDEVLPILNLHGITDISYIEL